jgi:hypothetical protein
MFINNMDKYGIPINYNMYKIADSKFEIMIDIKEDLDHDILKKKISIIFGISRLHEYYPVGKRYGIW